MDVKEYIIKRYPNHGAYYIIIYYEDSLPLQYGPFTTLRGAKKQIKKWGKENEKDKVIVRYNKDGKKIEPLSWRDFC